MKTKLPFRLMIVLILVLAALPAQAPPVVAAPEMEGVRPPLPEQPASVLVESLSAGYFHTCGLKSDGTLVCWGRNTYGQSTPPVGTFTQVSAGADHTCGLKSDGTIACWGRNNYNQSTPPGGTFTQVSTGEYHTCGLKSNGTLACWGAGTTNTGNDPEYGQSMPPTGTFTQVSAGAYHTCGLKSDGTLTCWGSNDFGQTDSPPGTFFAQVSTGAYHTCGLKSGGGLICWGNNGSGQTTAPGGTFTQVSAGYYHTCGRLDYGTLVCWGDNTWSQTTAPTGTFTQVSAGDHHTCGVKSDGTLACWGDNTYSQSTPPSGAWFGRNQINAGGKHTCWLKSDGTLACWGDNTNGQATPPSGTFTQVSAGLEHTCGLKSDGTLACWGRDDGGQASPPFGTYIQVSAGGANSCALMRDSQLTCWGDDYYGQSTPPPGNFTQVSAGDRHTCGVKSDGTVHCWGDNSYYQSDSPANTFTQVSAGGYHTCGLRTDGTLKCWGAGTTNTGTNPEYGQSMPPSGTFTQVSAGHYHTCGLKSNGTLACWGRDDGGQASPPTGTFTQVSAGDYHTCGLKSDGTLSCWGYNIFNQSKPFSISGSVGLTGAGATLSYTDGDPTSTTADGSGNYGFAVSYNWSGMVTPSLAGYTFTPDHRDYTNVLANQNGQNYTALPKPGTFNKTNPVNLATEQPNNPILSWGASTNAASYEYCLSSAACTAASTWVSTGTAISKALSGLTPGAKYYWQVRARNATGITYANGVVTASWTFTVTLKPGAFSKTSPTYAAVDQPNNPTLRWGSALTAASYEYCLSSAVCTAASTWVSTGTATSKALSGLTPGAKYYWQVRAVNASGMTYANDHLAASWTFTVTLKPDAFSKTSPVNAAVDQLPTPTLSWGSASGAASYEYCFDTTNDSLCSGTWTSTGTLTSTTLSGLKRYTTYYWQVRAVNTSGMTYANSGSWWSFRTVPITSSFQSVGTYDGWIRESTSTSGVGGSLNTTAETLLVGDDTLNRQLRSILSFDTSKLPDTAVITQVLVKVMKQFIGGTNPFTILGGLNADITKPYFGTTVGLVVTDFQAAAGKAGAGTFGATPIGGWYIVSLASSAYPYVNLTGTTQVRLLFATDSNNNSVADYIQFYSGDAATVANRPVLFVKYYVP